MCGIVAILHTEKPYVEADIVVRMRDAMHHRGPDDAGLYLNEHVALGHRRLSIIDLTVSGRQPMGNEDGSVQLVFNGEIYNYKELRPDLIARGHRFSSSTDSEVIIHQYEKDGPACLDKFNGMFAFVIWDANRQTLFAARDRLGIKPLYYYLDADMLILASEIKAIVAHPKVPRIPDPQAIADLFFAGKPLGEKTIFKHIRQVEPGHKLVFHRPSRKLELDAYWDIAYRYDHGRNDQSLDEELMHLLDHAVRVHCRSDASLGCHLSGGMDTSIVTALAARHRRELKTFSIKFSDDAHIDETLFAKAVAHHVDAQYVEGTPTAQDIESLIPHLVWQMDMPVAAMSGYAYYSVSALAAQNVKVSLTGHGGDEAFAGYPAQFMAAFNRHDMFRLHIDPARLQPLPLWKRLLSPLAMKSRHLLERVQGVSPARRQALLDERWINLHCNKIPQQNPIFKESFIQSLGGYSPREDYLQPFHTAATDEILDRCLYHDLRSYLPGLLHIEDRASMAVSIESRVPLLDHRVIEFLATVPPSQKVKNLEPKHLLRQVGAQLVPPEVWQRKDKRPFPMPARLLSSSGIQDMTRRLLGGSEGLARDIIRSEILDGICQDGSATRHLEPRIIFFLELWSKLYVQHDPDWLELAHRPRPKPDRNATSKAQYEIR